MAAKPVALPEIFTGDGKQSWSDWLDHFDGVADVNEWDAGAKRKWIQARLTGRVATAFRRLPEADRETFDKIVAALRDLNRSVERSFTSLNFKEDKKGEIRTGQLLERI